MRGEDSMDRIGRTRSVGSPPHARGRPYCTARLRYGMGITPACAGKTMIDPFSLAASLDHPRMRGEDYATHLPLLSNYGSPPHARGRQLFTERSNKEMRITPACAGKTYVCHASSETVKDHPRMRGEDMAISISSKFVDESPPHARGRHHLEDCDLVGVGITPACAGKTCTSFLHRTFCRDHPRMRGEDTGMW